VGQFECANEDRGFVKASLVPHNRPTQRARMSHNKRVGPTQNCLPIA